MRWDESHRSNDIIDRRGDAPPTRLGGGGGGGLLALLPLLTRTKYGWIILLAFLAFSYFGGSRILGGGDGAPANRAAETETTGLKSPDKKAAFVGFVLDDAQTTWRELLPGKYQNAKLVLFTGATNTGCGYGESATGPFYCPADERVYIDLAFYDELERRLGAKGDFAQAYVIAHEIGHHVQNLLGVSDRVHRAARGEQQGATGLSVRLELQADCYAGLWGHGTNNRGLLESGDLEEALNAAQAIGDDTLQKNAGRTVRPESFSHGSSAQRARWFKKGFETGKVEACDTFNTTQL